MIAGAVSAQSVSLTIPSGHASPIEAITASPNGKYIASGSNKTVLIWDVASNKKIHEINLGFSATRSNVASLSITDKLDKIVAYSKEGGIVCHDIQTGKKLFDIGGYISGGSFSKDGRSVYTCDDGSLGIYNAVSGKLIKRIYKTVKTSSESGCYFYELPDNQLLITSERGWCIVNTGTDQVVVKQQFEYSSSFKGFQTIKYNPALNTVIAQKNDTISIYEANTARVLRSKTYPAASRPRGFCLTDKNQLAVFYDEYKQKAYKTDILQAQDFGTIRTVSEPGYDDVLFLYHGTASVAVPGSGYIACNNGSEISFLNTDKGDYEKRFNNSIADFKPFYIYRNLSQRLMPDNSLRFSTDDNGIRQFNDETYKPENYVQGADHVTDRLILSPDGKLAATIDKKITIINARTGKPNKTLPVPSSIEDIYMVFFFFNHDNTKLMYADWEKGRLSAIDIATGVPSVYASLGGIYSKYSASFDGKYFAYTQYINNKEHLLVYNLKTKKTELRNEYGGDISFLNDSYYILSIGGTSANPTGTVCKADDPSYVSKIEVNSRVVELLGGDTKNNIIAIGGTGITLISKEGRQVRQFPYVQNNEILKVTFSADGKVMFASTNQKGIQVWNVQTGELLGTYYLVEGSNEYVFVSPEGLFDGSEKGMKALYFVKNNKPVPLEKLYEQYFTPDLLRRKLNGEKFLPPDVAGLLDVPTVSIAYAEKQRNLSVDDDIPVYQNTSGIAEITVKADAGESAIDEIRLFHNGKIVTLVTRNLIVTDDKAKTAVKKYTINLLPGSNHIRAVALNTQRTESDPDQITVVYNAGNNSGVTPPVVHTGSGAVVDKIDKNATLHLIVVGINAYKNPKMSLNYALADATAFKEEIEKGAQTVISNIKPYFVTDHAADKQGIVSALNTIQQTAKPQDVFIFYYAGHGVIAGGNNEFYLVPNDVMDLKNVDEALKASGIAARELQQYAINIQAQKQLFILDACQSAGAFAAMLSADGNQQKNIALVARSTGTHWMAASGAQQFANEFSALGHGAFTYVLLQALKGEAASNKMITVDGLKNYMQAGVPALMKKYNGTQQTPASYGFGNDFPVEILK